MLVAGLDGVDTEGGWGCGGEVGFVVGAEFAVGTAPGLVQG